MKLQVVIKKDKIITIYCYSNNKIYCNNHLNKFIYNFSSLTYIIRIFNIQIEKTINHLYF